MKSIRIVFLFFLLSISYVSVFANYANTFFLKKNISFEQLEKTNSADWKSFDNEINKGLDNGVYWIKIQLKNSSEHYIIQIPEAHISDVKAFTFNGKHIDLIKGSRYPTLNTEVTHTKEYIYLRINCLLDAHIPINITPLKKHYSIQSFEQLKIGMYYGIVLSIIIVNLFLFISFKTTNYKLYIFMALSMAFNAFYKDGIFTLLFGSGGWLNYIEPSINSCLAISVIFFTRNYLQLDVHAPKMQITAIITIGIATISNVILWITKDFLFFAITDIILLIGFDIYWVIGIMLWKKTEEAKYYTLAYGIPLLLAHSYYIFPHFGINWFKLPFSLYRLGSVCEMTLFTYLLITNAKKLAKENQLIRHKTIKLIREIRKNHQISLNQIDPTHYLIDKFKFTLKEVEIYKNLIQDLSNKEIADQQFISVNTVKYHIKNIFKKLEVNNRQEASQIIAKSKD